jgi:hypothetical protein
MKPTHIIIITIIIITAEEEESSSIFQTSQFCDCHIKKTKKIVAVKKNIAPEMQNHLTPHTKMENSQNREEEN